MTGVGGLVAAVGEWSGSQRVLRLLVLLAPVGAILAGALAGAQPPWWLVLVVAITGLVSSWAPESGAPLVGSTVVLAWWCRVPDDGLSGWILLAAALLVGGHVAALLAATGPPEALVSPALVRRWVTRGALVLLAAPLAWVSALAVRGAVSPAGAWASGMLAGVLALVAASVALTGRRES